MNTQRYVGPVLVVIALAAVFAVAGVNVAALTPIAIILLVCALTMFFMIRDMHRGGSDQDDHSAHTGPGRTNDR